MFLAKEIFCGFDFLSIRGTLTRKNIQGKLLGGDTINRSINFKALYLISHSIAKVLRDD
jgi:hypothetical protein